MRSFEKNVLKELSPLVSLASVFMPVIDGRDEDDLGLIHPQTGTSLFLGAMLTFVRLFLERWSVRNNRRTHVVERYRTLKMNGTEKDMDGASRSARGSTPNNAGRVTRDTSWRDGLFFLKLF